MIGTLFIVATPIGNLDDISLRAIKVLQQVDLIAAEDTRHSSRLLSHLGISKKLFSLHEHNEYERIEYCLQRLNNGLDIALISDAGTPLISDPGFTLVRAMQKEGIKVSPIPGASSVIAALSCAGLPTNEFSYFGFLSHKNSERLTKLEQLRQVQGTLVLLESTHRIIRLLEQIQQVMGNVTIVLAKELTKSYENFIRGAAREILDLMEQDPALVKGEFVVLIDNIRRVDGNEKLTADKILISALMTELPVKKAVKVAVLLSESKKNALYQLALDLRPE